jgi:hypothetical protein
MKASGRTCLQILFLLFPIVVSAQWQKKPYSQWSEKEALNVLNNSPWGQTQTVADTSTMFGALAARTGPTGEQEVPKTNFRIRFFSAKPIRQAISRLVEIKQKGEMNKQLAGQLKALADADFPDYIIITVITDFTESGTRMGAAAALLDNLTSAQLKNGTYLAVGGQRVFLEEYQPPRKDGLGARFVFPRMVDGKPFISLDSGEVLFHSDISKANVELNMRFKIKDMMFDGKLEY